MSLVSIQSDIVHIRCQQLKVVAHDIEETDTVATLLCRQKHIIHINKHILILRC